MQKLKIYLDTSVISHLYQLDALDKMSDTLSFWEQLKTGKYDIYISDLTFAELAKCSAEKQNILSTYIDTIIYTDIYCLRLDNHKFFT